MLEERGIEHAAGSQAWLRRTLEEIVSQVRRLLDVTGVSFLVVDAAHAHIRPAASWFASDAVRDAFVPVLDRPYEPERAGVTEAAIERGSPVRIERIEDWPGAPACTTACSSASTPTAPSACGTGTAPPRSSPARCAPAMGASSACSRSPARCRSPPSAPRTCGSRRCSPTSPRSRSSALSCSTTRRRSAAPRRAVSATLDPAEVVAAAIEQVRALTGARDVRFDCRGRRRAGARRRRAGADRRRGAGSAGARRAAVRRAHGDRGHGRVRARRRRPAGRAGPGRRGGARQRARLRPRAPRGARDDRGLRPPAPARARRP